jgi:hypothetical protein
MTWGAVGGAAISVVGGMLGSKSAKKQQAASLAQQREAAALADPFRSQRPYYQEQLKQLQQDPSKYLSSSAFQNILGSTLDQAGRAMSARGQYGSGNYDNELMRSGTRVGLDYIDKEKNFLAKLAGGFAEPGYAGQSFASGMGNTFQAGQQGEASKMYGYGALGDLAKQYLGGKFGNSGGGSRNPFGDAGAAFGSGGGSSNIYV